MKTFADFGIDLGRKSGTEVKVLCPKCSHTRRKSRYPCLNVNTDKGVWNCWHCGWSGSLKAGEWQRPTIIKAYTRPRFEPIPKQDGVEQWFLTRGITKAVLERNGIARGEAYFPQVEEERTCIMFPYLRGEEIVNVKYRTHDKLFRMAAGAERILYGINDIGETLVWVEGEIDKLSVEVAGYQSCVSVPDGAPAPDTRDYSSKFDYLQEQALERVKTHILAVDNDPPGVRLQQELARRLGPQNCLVVSWPEGCKDANDVLVKLGADALEECLANAQPIPIEGVFQALSVIEELKRHRIMGQPKGISTGWEALDGLYRVMPGEWTLVTGIPGHGKSEWLDALALNLALREGWRFGVFSPENAPLAYHVGKLAEKYMGKPLEPGPTENMTEAEVEEATAWLNEHFFFHQPPESPTVDLLLQKATAMVLRHGIRGFILDPWNEVDHTRSGTMTETEYISQMLSRIRQWARNHEVHVWIVAHPTKLQKDATDKYPVPTPYDVSGSAHWRNKADNCIAIYRDTVSNDSAVEVYIQKVRKKVNGKVGKAALAYDRVTGQYRDARPRSSAYERIARGGQA